MARTKNEIIDTIRGLVIIVVMIWAVWIILGMYELQEPIVEAIGLILIGAGIIGGVIVIGWVSYEIYNWREEREERKKRKEIAQKKREQGLVEYHGKWIKPEEKEARKRMKDFASIWNKTEDPQVRELERKAKGALESGDFQYVHELAEKARGVATEKVNRVAERIREFEPEKEYDLEETYQRELRGFLSANFPSAKTEKTKSSSRPDIIINNIAIEVKGPTYAQNLDTIASKALRYPQNYEHLIVVLFDIHASENYLKDWKEGMKDKHPEVRIIEK